MRKLLLVLALLVVFAPAVAAAPKLPVALVVETGDGTATYSFVELRRGYAERESIWVAQWCYDASGVAVSARFAGLEGAAPTLVRDGVRCEAYAWAFPAAHDPVSAVLEV